MGAGGQQQADRLGRAGGWQGGEQAAQVAQGLGQAAARQQQQTAPSLEPSGERARGGEAIHHRVARGDGLHPMALQPPGGEAIAHRHQMAAAVAHQGPLPGIPFAALGPVVAIGQGGAAPAGGGRRGPGVVALRGAHEAVRTAARPGQQQGQQVAHRQDRPTLPAPAAHDPPLAPAQQRQPCRQIVEQSAQALVAEAAAGQRKLRADPPQLSGRFGTGEGLAHPHQGQHLHLQARDLLPEGLDQPQGDQILPMAVAQNQQTGGGHAMADTIRCGEFAPRQAAWPSGKAEDCKSFIPSSNLGAASATTGVLLFTPCAGAAAQRPAIDARLRWPCQ